MTTVMSTNQNFEVPEQIICLYIIKYLEYCLRYLLPLLLSDNIYQL